MKKVAILQSNYLPWLGYFQIINSVDEFIILDSVQYTKNDWRNRNKIKTKYGLKWITIPIKKGNLTNKSIDEVEVASTEWWEMHLNKIKENYNNALYFDEVFMWLLGIFNKCKNINSLSQINILFIKEICFALGINTKISNCRSYKYSGDKNEKLIQILIAAQANVYLSGPAAQSYIIEDLFIDNNIKIEWMQYNLDINYPQLNGEFNLYVSIIDALFNIGFNETKKLLNNL